MAIVIAGAEYILRAVIVALTAWAKHVPSRNRAIQGRKLAVETV